MAIIIGHKNIQQIKKNEIIINKNEEIKYVVKLKKKEIG